MFEIYTGLPREPEARHSESLLHGGWGKSENRNMLKQTCVLQPVRAIESCRSFFLRQAMSDQPQCAQDLARLAFGGGA